METDAQRKGLKDTVAIVSHLLRSEIDKYIEEENWDGLELLFDSCPDLSKEINPSTGELPLHTIARYQEIPNILIEIVLMNYPEALVHRDKMGALPIHHAAGQGNIKTLEIIYGAYRAGADEYDNKGRLPIHVAAEFHSEEGVKFFLKNVPESAHVLIKQSDDSRTRKEGGGLALHVACRNYGSLNIITALLSENFLSAQQQDDNGDLPLHLLLRCGKVVDRVIVKTLVTFFPQAAACADANGDLPLSISLIHSCRSSVIRMIFTQNPRSAKILNNDGHSALFLGLKHDADDRIIVRLVEYAPELVVQKDKKTGLLPIQIATRYERSHILIYYLLLRDLPIDKNQKVKAKAVPHKYSWNHIVSGTSDVYYPVVQKLLKQCTQPQVVMLAKVQDEKKRLCIDTATPVCRHEIRIAMRLFNTIEVTDPTPAYSNPNSATKIFYSLRYNPPSDSELEDCPDAIKILRDETGDNKILSDAVEDLDDRSSTGISVQSQRSIMTEWSQRSIDRKMKAMRKEKGMQVIVKLTPRRDVMERELNVRKLYKLSRNYVPAVLSVYHTIQHEAYANALAEPGYCITMEGADITLENLLSEMRQNGSRHPVKTIKRIGISLLHIHEKGLVHGDFGAHNVGKFRHQWKVLGISGSVAIGERTDPNRGFFFPPEAIEVDSKRNLLRKISFSPHIISINAQPSYDIWAFGVMVFEILSGKPMPIYASRQSMTDAERVKLGRFDNTALKKTLKRIKNENGARDLLSKLLHPDPQKRFCSIRDMLKHNFFDKCNDCIKNSDCESKNVPPLENNSNTDGCDNSQGETASDLHASFKKNKIIDEVKRENTLISNEKNCKKLDDEKDGIGGASKYHLDKGKYEASSNRGYQYVLEETQKNIITRKQSMYGTPSQERKQNVSLLDTDDFFVGNL